MTHTTETRSTKAQLESTDPLDLYEPRGYAPGASRERRALDAAISLTASTWGPPFSSEFEHVDWCLVAYKSAMRGVENAIVDALTTEVGSR